MVDSKFKRNTFFIVIIFISIFASSRTDTPTWTQWSQCSSSCGYGVQVRYWKCDVKGDENCQKPFQKRNCYGDLCQNSKWTEWSSCSVTCGAGTAKKFRVCQPMANCTEPLSKTKYCHLSICLATTTSSTTKTKTTTTTETTTSKKTVDTAGTEKKSATTAIVTTVATVIAEDAWTNWSDCSAQCGDGNHTKYQMCNTNTTEKANIALTLFKLIRNESSKSPLDRWGVCNVTMTNCKGTQCPNTLMTALVLVFTCTVIVVTLLSLVPFCSRRMCTVCKKSKDKALLPPKAAPIVIRLHSRDVKIQTNEREDKKRIWRENIKKKKIEEENEKEEVKKESIKEIVEDKKEEEKIIKKDSIIVEELPEKQKKLSIKSSLPHITTKKMMQSKQPFQSDLQRHSEPQDDHPPEYYEKKFLDSIKNNIALAKTHFMADDVLNAITGHRGVEGDQKELVFDEAEVFDINPDPIDLPMFYDTSMEHFPMSREESQKRNEWAQEQTKGLKDDFEKVEATANLLRMHKLKNHTDAQVSTPRFDYRRDQMNENKINENMEGSKVDNKEDGKRGGKGKNERGRVRGTSLMVDRNRSKRNVTMKKYEKVKESKDEKKTEVSEREENTENDETKANTESEEGEEKTEMDECEEKTEIDQPGYQDISVNKLASGDSQVEDRKQKHKFKPAEKNSFKKTSKTLIIRCAAKNKLKSKHHERCSILKRTEKPLHLVTKSGHHKISYGDEDDNIDKEAYNNLHYHEDQAVGHSISNFSSGNFLEKDQPYSQYGFYPITNSQSNLNFFDGGDNEENISNKIASNLEKKLSQNCMDNLSSICETDDSQRRQSSDCYENPVQSKHYFQHFEENNYNLGNKNIEKLGYENIDKLGIESSNIRNDTNGSIHNGNNMYAVSQGRPACHEDYSKIKELQQNLDEVNKSNCTFYLEEEKKKSRFGMLEEVDEKFREIEQLRDNYATNVSKGYYNKMYSKCPDGKVINYENRDNYVNSYINEGHMRQSYTAPVNLKFQPLQGLNNKSITNLVTNCNSSTGHKEHTSVTNDYNYHATNTANNCNKQLSNTTNNSRDQTWDDFDQNPIKMTSTHIQYSEYNHHPNQTIENERYSTDNCINPDTNHDNENFNNYNTYSNMLLKQGLDTTITQTQNNPETAQKKNEKNCLSAENEEMKALIEQLDFNNTIQKEDYDKLIEDYQNLMDKIEKAGFNNSVKNACEGDEMMDWCTRNIFENKREKKGSFEDENLVGKIESCKALTEIEELAIFRSPLNDKNIKANFDVEIKTQEFPITNFNDEINSNSKCYREGEFQSITNLAANFCCDDITTRKIEINQENGKKEKGKDLNRNEKNKQNESKLDLKPQNSSSPFENDKYGIIQNIPHQQIKFDEEVSDKNVDLIQEVIQVKNEISADLKQTRKENERYEKQHTHKIRQNMEKSTKALDKFPVYSDKTSTKDFLLTNEEEKYKFSAVSRVTQDVLTQTVVSKINQRSVKTGTKNGEISTKVSKKIQCDLPPAIRPRTQPRGKKLSFLEPSNQNTALPQKRIYKLPSQQPHYPSPIRSRDLQMEKNGHSMVVTELKQKFEDFLKNPKVDLKAVNKSSSIQSNTIAHVIKSSHYKSNNKTRGHRNNEPMQTTHSILETNKDTHLNEQKHSLLSPTHTLTPPPNNHPDHTHSAFTSLQNNRPNHVPSFFHHSQNAPNTTPHYPQPNPSYQIPSATNQPPYSLLLPSSNYQPPFLLPHPTLPNNNHLLQPFSNTKNPNQYSLYPPYPAHPPHVFSQLNLPPKNFPQLNLNPTPQPNLNQQHGNLANFQQNFPDNFIHNIGYLATQPFNHFTNQTPYKRLGSP